MGPELLQRACEHALEKAVTAREDSGKIGTPSQTLAKFDAAVGDRHLGLNFPEVDKNNDEIPIYSTK